MLIVYVSLLVYVLAVDFQSMISNIVDSAGNWLVHVVLRVSFPWKKLGQGWKNIEGMVKPDHLQTHLNINLGILIL